ncbi:VanZ family protein, partial [Streptomyces sp. UH6]|nr:VanZ family protein [Streptomyces sp. UH6]
MATERAIRTGDGAASGPPARRPLPWPLRALAVLAGFALLVGFSVLLARLTL